MAVFLLEYLVVKPETNGHNTGCFFHNIISGARLKNIMIGHEKNNNALVHINTNTVSMDVCMNNNALVHINTNTVSMDVCMNNNALVHINTNTVSMDVCMNKKVRRRGQLT